MTPLTPLQVASGLVLGVEPAALPRDAPSPLDALEAAVLPALKRAPCLVSFSGGRDSSAVLAVATHVARRHGLPLPVPATNRFRDAPGSDEDEWQERVVSHLGLDDWLRLDHAGELDCVGPVARDVLRRHGLLWPFNAHFHVPLLRAATGGSLLTGIGGDEVLGDGMTTRPLAILTGRERPTRGDLKPVAWTLAPRPLRAAAVRRRHPATFPWLRPTAVATLRRLLADQNAREPLRRRAQLEWRLGFRYLEVGRHSLGLLAADDDVLLAHPLLDPRFAVAVAGVRAPHPYAGRAELMRAIFGDLLPAETIERTTKSQFDEAFWHDSSRAFAARWSGAGVDPVLADADVLRAEWASGSPNPRTYTQLQAAWLAEEGSAGDRVEQPAEVGLDTVPAG